MSIKGQAVEHNRLNNNLKLNNKMEKAKLIVR
jgi:hypothetical protein